MQNQKQIQICHISDWHGKISFLPKADIYVVTGDMLPNFPQEEILSLEKSKVVKYDPYDPAGSRPLGHYLGRIIDKQSEMKRQKQWCLNNPFRKSTGILENSPVVVVKGNHDFINLEEWIGGDVYEILNPSQSFDVLGLKFGGFKGINIISFEWDDEISRDEFSRRVSLLPKDLDVLVTHSPPFGILDGEEENYGSPAIRWWIDDRVRNKDPLKAHFFGHVHECANVVSHDGIIFSNAACSMNEFDFKK